MARKADREGFEERGLLYVAISPEDDICGLSATIMPHGTDKTVKIPLESIRLGV